MKLKSRLIILLFLVCGLAMGQNDIQLRLKTLEVRGLPYFYCEEIETTVNDWLKNENESTSIFYGRLQYYGEKIERIQEKYGLPWFVKYIPAGSSGFEPRYRDESGASGIWPLSYTIGKKYNLKEVASFDERRDPEKSTEAACLYLRDLYHIYGDWLKVITAFRIGPIRLNQVIHKLGGDLEFTHIYNELEPEECLPVIQFYAALMVLHHAKQYGIEPIVVKEIDAVEVKSVNTVLPFSILTEKFGLSLSDLRSLNPEFRADMVPFLGIPCNVKLPAHIALLFNEKRDSIASWITIESGVIPGIVLDTSSVHNGDSLAMVVVVKSDVSPTDSASVTHPIPKSNFAVDNNKKTWVYYRIKSGDAIYTLSDIFDCTPKQLTHWNSLRGNNLRVGSMLKFYVPLKRNGYYKKLNSLSISQKRKIAGSD